MVNRKSMQVDDEFKREINKLLAERVTIGTDKFIESERRITKALAHTIKLPEIREIIIKTPFENDRKFRRSKRK